jgi:hypothetical protein
VDVQRLRSALRQSVALAIGFRGVNSIYLIIGQLAFALWAVAPILFRIVDAQVRRRHDESGHTAAAIKDQRSTLQWGELVVITGRQGRASLRSRKSWPISADRGRTRDG